MVQQRSFLSPFRRFALPERVTLKPSCEILLRAKKRRSIAIVLASIQCYMIKPRGPRYESLCILRQLPLPHIMLIMLIVPTSPANQMKPENLHWLLIGLFGYRSFVTLSPSHHGHCMRHFPLPFQLDRYAHDNTTMFTMPQADTGQPLTVV
jgi:hypothetical protein